MLASCMILDLSSFFLLSHLLSYSVTLLASVFAAFLSFFHCCICLIPCISYYYSYLYNDKKKQYTNVMIYPQAPSSHHWRIEEESRHRPWIGHLSAETRLCACTRLRDLCALDLLHHPQNQRFLPFRRPSDRLLVSYWVPSGKVYEEPAAGIRAAQTIGLRMLRVMRYGQLV